MDGQRIDTCTLNRFTSGYMQLIFIEMGRGYTKHSVHVPEQDDDKLTDSRKKKKKTDL